MAKDLIDKIKNRKENSNTATHVSTEAEAAGAGPETPSTTSPQAEHETPITTPPEAEPKTVVPEPTKAPRDEKKAKGSKRTSPTDAPSTYASFDDLHNVLKAEKESFTFNKRQVYVDDDVADILDLVKRKTKINSNLLVSFLIQEFFLKNKELLQELKDKKENRFLE